MLISLVTQCRNSHQRCSIKKVLLKISLNSQENSCARVSFLIKKSLFIKKETLAQEFSCEFCETFKNTFLFRTPLVAASVNVCNSTQLPLISIYQKRSTSHNLESMLWFSRKATSSQFYLKRSYSS